VPGLARPGHEQFQVALHATTPDPRRDRLEPDPAAHEELHQPGPLHRLRPEPLLIRRADQPERAPLAEPIHRLAGPAREVDDRERLTHARPRSIPSSGPSTSRPWRPPPPEPQESGSLGWRPSSTIRAGVQRALRRAERSRGPSPSYVTGINGRGKRATASRVLTFTVAEGLEPSGITEPT